jgi:hypothetical protein
MQRRLIRSFGLLLAGVCLVAGCARRLPPAERVETTNVKALRSSFGGGATEAAGPAAAVAEPTGWATLKGSFKLNGSPPDRPPLTIDKDQGVCAPGGRAVLSETLVIDSASHGIKDVVIFMALPNRRKFPVGDAKWEHPDYAASRETTLEFDQKACVFLTHMFGMRSQQKAKILNSDPVGHNTNIAGGGRAGTINATIPAGASAMYEPGGESAEPFAVSCNIHSWMSARMIVRDNPCFAVSKADGSFTIPNVPAGVPLEFRVWQEKAGFLTKGNVNGKDETWPNKTIKVTFQPDETKPFDVVFDVAMFAK